MGGDLRQKENMTTELRPARRFGSATKSTGPEIPELDDDNYAAVVKTVNESTATYDGEPKEQFVVEWELLDCYKPDKTRYTLRGYVSIPPALVSEGRLNSKSNLYGLLMALGYTDETLEVNPDAWLGKECRVTVVNKTIESGENAGTVRPRITGYLAKKGKRTQPEPPFGTEAEGAA
jgi:hypothetical protein